MSLILVIISAVALTVAYACLGIAVVFSIRDARNTAEEFGIQPYERHWLDFTECLMDYSWQLFVAMVGVAVATTALMISCIC